MKNKETKYREEGGPRPGRVNAVKALNGTRAWRARGANSRAAPHGPRTEGQMASWEKEKCTKTRGRCLADHGAQRNAIRGPKRPFWVDKDRVERSRARVGSGAAARSVPRGEKAEEARRRRVINSQRRKPCRPTGHNGPPPRRRATRKRRPSGVVCANAETVKRQRERETRKKKKKKRKRGRVSSRCCAHGRWFAFAVFGRNNNATTASGPTSQDGGNKKRHPPP